MTINDESMAAPEITGVINEFKEQHLSAKCFVRLFPLGKAGQVKASDHQINLCSIKTTKYQRLIE